MKTRPQKKSRTDATKLAKSWLMAQPDFQEMMIRFANRVADNVVEQFHHPTDKALEDLLVGNLLVFWNNCDDDILGQALLDAVRGLEQEVLHRGSAEARG